VDHSSPAFAREEVPVEFLVLHYTACSLEATLKLFCGPEAKTCAHFVLDTDGSVHDLGHFWSGPILRGAHAGVSSFELTGHKWESFNRFSIGIEIVNLNGNLLPYTEEQYQSLAQLVAHLQSRFPELKKAERVVGHEQIAGFRGKCDPGLRFDWKRFYAASFPGQPFPSRPCKLTPDALARFETANGKADPARMKGGDWSELSSKLEKFLADSK
jgi:N-acetylmuramoyl-L-alanine amidase